MAGGGI
ncbi:hypothetical protein YPPY32_3275, partial [Yersinia pestis PY-32]